MVVDAYLPVQRGRGSGDAKGRGVVHIFWKQGLHWGLGVSEVSESLWRYLRYTIVHRRRTAASPPNC